MWAHRHRLASKGGYIPVPFGLVDIDFRERTYFYEPG
jgi:hypothetical protein